jgi:RNA polymerase sigma factor (sigma-70 family)
MTDDAAAAAGPRPDPDGPSHSASPTQSASREERLTQLFNEYHGRLVKFLAARTRSWDEARELAAATFEHILSRKQTASINFFAAYLYRTARNLATDELRKRATQRRNANLVRYDPTAPDPAPESIHVESERLAVLQRAREQLAPHLRMALALRLEEDLSDSEIVARFAQMGVPICDRTVRRYLTTAFTQLRLAVMDAESPTRERTA